MAFDLKTMTRKELEKHKSDIERTLARMIEREKKSALTAAQKAARTYGFDLDELIAEQQPKQGRQAKKRSQAGSAPPKYRHPENAGVTWTGKGRQPNWIKEAEAAGRSRDEFLIKA